MAPADEPKPKPFMSPLELQLLAECLDRAELYLEFGSGGTTLEATQRGQLRCVSVESDPQWIERLSSIPEVAEALKEDRLKLHHADIGPVGRWSFPVDDTPSYRWANYYLSVWSALEREPDLILVDGRFRLACCITAFLASSERTHVLLHDFGVPDLRRQNYTRVLEIAHIVRRAGTLVVLRKNDPFDAVKALSLLNLAQTDFW